MTFETDLEMVQYLLRKLGETSADMHKTARTSELEPVYEKTYPGHFYEHSPRVESWQEVPNRAVSEIEFRTNGFLFDDRGNLVSHWAEYD